MENEEACTAGKASWIEKVEGEKHFKVGGKDDVEILLFSDLKHLSKSHGMAQRAQSGI